MAYAEKRGKTWRARFLKPDGTYGSEPGFPTKKAAQQFGDDQESAIRAKTWIDPARGEILLDAYAELWFPAQDIAPRTLQRYRGYYRNHISVAFGAKPLNGIDPLEVDVFEKEKRDKLAPNTVEGVMLVLRMMMADAVYEKRIGTTPVRPKRRRGKRKAPDVRTRKGIAVELEVIEALRSRMPAEDALLVLVAAFSGMRWGEVIGMRRKYLMLVPDAPGGASGYYVIDEKDGSVHENDDGTMDYGAPKGNKGRTIELPPFLVVLLAAYLAMLPAQQQLLFPNGNGVWHRRGNWGRRRWRPACDGWKARKAVRGRAALEAAPPILKGLRFHDLRHTHETWMTEDHVPKVARDERLGHATPGMEGVYNHATPAMRKEILDVLAARWERYQGALRS